MTNKQVEETVRVGKLIRSRDDARNGGDAFKLPAWLKTLHEARLTACLQLDEAQQLATGDRTRSAALKREALERLEQRLRDGYNFIKAIPGYELESEAVRRGIFEAYGWDGGMLGELNGEGRLLALGRKALATAAVIQPVRARYPQALLDLLGHELGVIAALEPKATVGARRVVTAARNQALEALATANSRVRHYLCACSDETDKSSELATIGFQPRRATGQRLIAIEKP